MFLISTNKKYLGGTRIYIALLFYLFFLFSCKPNSTYKGKIFKYNQASGISSLDPVFARDQANIWGVHQLYNGLLQFNQDLNIIPSIAKSWTISDDGLAYTFYLRQDVFFHEDSCFTSLTRKVKASDVVYSFQRLINPKTASPGAWIFNERLHEHNPFEAPNDSTFVLRLRQSFRPILSMLAMPYTYIVPFEAVEKYAADFRIHPVGTGPFQLKIWKESNVMLLEKNKLYFEKDSHNNTLPYLDAVKINFIESKESQYLKFLQGEIDFMSGLDKSYIDELLNENGELKKEFHQRFYLIKSPYLNTEYLGILQDTQNPILKNHPLREVKFRQAINYAFDRQALLHYFRKNIGYPAHSGFVPPGLPSFDSLKVEGYHYDEKKARALLAEIGWDDNKQMPLTTLYVNSSYEDLGLYIQQKLKDVGIMIKIENVPSAFLREQMAKSNAMFFRASWIADYPDAESFLTVFYGKNAAPPNYTRFSNALFDSLYLNAVQENEDTIRYGIYQKMDSILLAESPVIPLFYDQIVRFVKKGFVGLNPNAMNILELKYVDYKPE